MGEFQEKPGDRMSDWTTRHGQAMADFLQYLNSRTSNLVLKGGTALTQCYGLTRFSEDLDFDGISREIGAILISFARERGYGLSVGKDTETVQRFYLDYGVANHRLKVETSYRRQHIPEEDVVKVAGITVYTINRLASQKGVAYGARERLRDLNDVAFMINNHAEQIHPETISAIRDAVAFKGIEQFDYLIETQHDELINTDVLAVEFLTMWEKLGLFTAPQIDQAIAIPNQTLVQAAFPETDPAQITSPAPPSNPPRYDPAILTEGIEL